MKPVLSSLADFIGASLRLRTPLTKAITFAFAVEFAGVPTRVFWFAGDARPMRDDAVMGRAFGLPASVGRLDAIFPPTLSKASESLKTVRTPGG